MASSIPASAMGSGGRRTLHAQQELWRRFARNRAALAGFVFAVLFTFVGLFAPLVAPFTPLDLGDSFVPPSGEHRLGSDNLGGDVLSNIIYGARTSLIVGVFSVLTSTLIGATIGALSGFFAGPADRVLMPLTDMVLVLPQFFLAIVIIAIFGSGLWSIIAVIGLLNWPGTARLLRAEFLALRKREYVEAARALGTSNFDLIVREILPNALPPIIVNSTLQISGAILLEASLSFLGLGDPTVMSWGVMLHNAQDSFHRAWWVALFPGLALFLTTLGLNLMGDGLNDALNPRMRGPT